MNAPRIVVKELYTPFIARFGGHSAPCRSSPDAQIIPVLNPATGEKITDVLSASATDVHEAIDIAQSAFESGIWSKTNTLQRSMVLSRLARCLEARVPELAALESLQTGRAIREMKAQLRRLPEWLDYYAALLRTYQGFVAPTQGNLLNYITRAPLGVVAQITPFNHPLLIAIKKIAPALAMGNSIIVKPSELAPISVLEFAEMADGAGVPSGVLQVLTGPGSTTGKELISNPAIKKVDITAGTKTGREIGHVIGQNLGSYTAELGGKAPILIFEDAYIQAAANGSAFAAFIASGQTCVSGTRLIVHSAIYDEFMHYLLDKTRDITNRIGNPLNFATMMGPVISSPALLRIHSMVSNRSSGKLLMGGEKLTGLSPLDGFNLSAGFFYPPTIIEDVDISDELWQEEVFGPVVIVKKFDEEEEAIQLANATRYGLGAGIWTKDLSKAHCVSAKIESGLVWVNCHHRNDPSSPWGGMKESGIGRENGIEAFESYSQSKSVIVNYASQKEIQEKEDWFSGGEEEKRYG